MSLQAKWIELDNTVQNIAKSGSHTEMQEKRAVQNFLSNFGYSGKPSVIQEKTKDGASVRIYVWLDTPIGHVALVSGNNYEPQLHYLIYEKDHDGKEEIYLVIKGRNNKDNMVAVSIPHEIEKKPRKANVERVIEHETTYEQPQKLAVRNNSFKNKFDQYVPKKQYSSLPSKKEIIAKVKSIKKYRKNPIEVFATEISRIPDIFSMGEFSKYFIKPYIFDTYIPNTDQKVVLYRADDPNWKKNNIELGLLITATPSNAKDHKITLQFDLRDKDNKDVYKRWVYEYPLPEFSRLYSTPTMLDLQIQNNVSLVFKEIVIKDLLPKLVNWFEKPTRESHEKLIAPKVVEISKTEVKEIVQPQIIETVVEPIVQTVAQPFAQPVVDPIVDAIAEPIVEKITEEYLQEEPIVEEPIVDSHRALQAQEPQERIKISGIDLGFDKSKVKVEYNYCKDVKNTILNALHISEYNERDRLKINQLMDNGLRVEGFMNPILFYYVQVESGINVKINKSFMDDFFVTTGLQDRDKLNKQFSFVVCSDRQYTLIVGTRKKYYEYKGTDVKLLATYYDKFPNTIPQENIFNLFFSKLEEPIVEVPQQVQSTNVPTFDEMAQVVRDLYAIDGKGEYLKAFRSLRDGDFWRDNSYGEYSDVFENAPQSYSKMYDEDERKEKEFKLLKKLATDQYWNKDHKPIISHFLKGDTVDTSVYTSPILTGLGAVVLKYIENDDSAGGRLYHSLVNQAPQEPQITTQVFEEPTSQIQDELETQVSITNDVNFPILRTGASNNNQPVILSDEVIKYIKDISNPIESYKDISVSNFEIKSIEEWEYKSNKKNFTIPSLSYDFLVVSVKTTIIAKDKTFQKTKPIVLILKKEFTGEQIISKIIEYKDLIDTNDLNAQFIYFCQIRLINHDYWVSALMSKETEKDLIEKLQSSSLDQWLKLGTIEKETIKRDLFYLSKDQSDLFKKWLLTNKKISGSFLSHKEIKEYIEKGNYGNINKYKSLLEKAFQKTKESRFPVYQLYYHLATGWMSMDEITRIHEMPVKSDAPSRIDLFWYDFTNSKYESIEDASEILKELGIIGIYESGTNKILYAEGMQLDMLMWIMYGDDSFYNFENKYFDAENLIGMKIAPQVLAEIKDKAVWQEVYEPQKITTQVVKDEPQEIIVTEVDIAEIPKNQPIVDISIKSNDLSEIKNTKVKKLIDLQPYFNNNLPLNYICSRLQGLFHCKGNTKWCGRDVIISDLTSDTGYKKYEHIIGLQDLSKGNLPVAFGFTPQEKNIRMRVGSVNSKGNFVTFTPTEDYGLTWDWNNIKDELKSDKGITYREVLVKFYAIALEHILGNANILAKISEYCIITTNATVIVDPQEAKEADKLEILTIQLAELNKQRQVEKLQKENENNEYIVYVKNNIVKWNKNFENYWYSSGRIKSKQFINDLFDVWLFGITNYFIKADNDVFADRADEEVKDHLPESEWRFISADSGWGSIYIDSYMNNMQDELTGVFRDIKNSIVNAKYNASNRDLFIQYCEMITRLIHVVHYPYFGAEDTTQKPLQQADTKKDTYVDLILASDLVKQLLDIGYKITEKTEKSITIDKPLEKREYIILQQYLGDKLNDTIAIIIKPTEDDSSKYFGQLSSVKYKLNDVYRNVESIETIFDLMRITLKEEGVFGAVEQKVSQAPIGLVVDQHPQQEIADFKKDVLSFYGKGEIYHIDGFESVVDRAIDMYVSHPNTRKSDFGSVDREFVRDIALSLLGETDLEHNVSKWTGKSQPLSFMEKIGLSQKLKQINEIGALQTYSNITKDILSTKVIKEDLGDTELEVARFGKYTDQEPINLLNLVELGVLSNVKRMDQDEKTISVYIDPKNYLQVNLLRYAKTVDGQNEIKSFKIEEPQAIVEPVVKQKPMSYLEQLHTIQKRTSYNKDICSDLKKSLNKVFASEESGKVSVLSITTGKMKNTCQITKSNATVRDALMILWNLRTLGFQNVKLAEDTKYAIENMWQTYSQKETEGIEKGLDDGGKIGTFEINVYPIEYIGENTNVDFDLALAEYEINQEQKPQLLDDALALAYKIGVDTYYADQKLGKTKTVAHHNLDLQDLIKGFSGKAIDLMDAYNKGWDKTNIQESNAFLKKQAEETQQTQQVQSTVEPTPRMYKPFSQWFTAEQVRELPNKTLFMYLSPSQEGYVVIKVSYYKMSLVEFGDLSYNTTSDLLSHYNHTTYDIADGLYTIIGLEESLEDSVLVALNRLYNLHSNKLITLNLPNTSFTLKPIEMVEQVSESVDEVKTNKYGFKYPVVYTSIFDANNVEYLTLYEIAIIDTLGTDGIQVSNIPFSFDLNKNYISEFQARDLSTSEEMAKIKDIARELNPRQMLNSTSLTIGSPVVYRYNDIDYVLGGNGRSIAIAMTDNTKYAEYLQNAKKVFPTLLSLNLAKIQEIYKNSNGRLKPLVVRSIYNLIGEPLTLEEAIMVAGASQGCTSAEETPLRKALSNVRGLGLSKINKMDIPIIANPMVIGVDTVNEFIQKNNKFWLWLLSKLSPTKQQQYRYINNATLPLIANQIMDILVGLYIPSTIISSGFGTESEESTFMTLLPLFVSITQQVEHGKLLPQYDLLPHLATARDFAVQIQSMPYAKALDYYKNSCEETSMFGSSTGFSEFCNLSLLGVGLALFLKRANQLTDPSTVVPSILEYIAKAQKDEYDRSQSSLDSMFGDDETFGFADQRTEQEKERNAGQLFIETCLPKTLATSLL